MLAGHNQRENKQPAGRYLPVAFTENEIGGIARPILDALRRKDLRP